MRSIITSILLLLALLLTAPAAMAYDLEADGIYYNYNDDGNTVEVTFPPEHDYDYAGAVTIPDAVTYGGTVYPVTRIGNSAFAACRDMTSVSIPSSVTSMGCSVFMGCTGLTNIVIPNTISTISDGAFLLLYLEASNQP